MKKLLLILFSLLLCPTWVQADSHRIEGTTNVEDTYVNSAQVDYNYGGKTTFEIVTTEVGLIRVKNVASELGAGATISACVCSLYVEIFGLTGTPVINAIRTFKPWVEGTQNDADPGVLGGCTWYDWDSDDYEWTTAGCACANDDGVDNSADDGVCDVSTRRDRKATAEGSQEITAHSTWYGFSISAALAQGWYDGTIEQEGITLQTSEGATQVIFHSTENASNQPHFTFTYTTEAPEGVDKPRKNIMSGGIVR